LEEIRDQFETDNMVMVINGCLGPRGDGHDPTHFMTVDQAEQYHSQQVGIFEDTAADMVSAP
jgi:S-methylmethionine-dependent homocysteine/selenocysteine methylase